MTKLDVELIPVLLGADLNCYNVARAFHEEYGVISYAFGRYAIGATMNTKIVKFTAIADMDTDARVIQVLNDFAKEHKGATLVVLGCTDDYVSLIVRCKDKLDPAYIAPYTTRELIDDITLKEHFYAYCDKYDIPHPKTFIHEKGMSIDDLGFDYPIIIKPSSSVLYWKHEFAGMKKVYRAKTKEEAQKILDEIYASGYPEKVIIQDTIPGDDSAMYVLTSYSDADANVRMMCLGHVLLEEHTPKGLGNHCAIITEKNRELMERFKGFLENLGFVGYSNFDIKYDSRDGSFRAFEINVRQGRSNYYVTASGNNIARNIVEDRVLKKPFTETYYSDNEIYWRYVPDKVVKERVSPELGKKIDSLKKAGKAYSSLRYKFDLKGNLKRRAFVYIHEHNHIKKFKTYLPVKK